MTVNAALLRQTLAHIEAHPAEWRQGVWARRTDCGTSYCFAGWACVLSGEEAEFYSTTPSWEPSGHLVSGASIPDRARELLGIEGVTLGANEVNAGELLFAPANTLSDLRTVVDWLCEEAGS